MKTLKPGAMSKDDFLKEAKIMKNLNHPKLVKLYAVCTDDPMYIITELMTHGSLLEYLQNGPGQHLEIVCLVDMMAQVRLCSHKVFGKSPIILSILPPNEL